MSFIMDATVVFFVIYFVQLVACDNFTLKSPEEIKKIQEKCVKETGHDGGFAALSEKEPTKDGKCYIKCVFINKELMAENGILNADLIKAYVGRLLEKNGDLEKKEKLFKSIEECAAKTKPNEDDLCETAWDYFNCRRKAGLVK